MSGRQFLWREALFPTGPQGFQFALYSRGERGLLGATYNLLVRSLHAVVALLNVILILPMLAVTILWFVVTSPVQLLRLVLPMETFYKVIDIVTYPGQVAIWWIYLPVKLLNLLIASLAYLFGPSSFVSPPPPPPMPDNSAAVMEPRAAAIAFLVELNALRAIQDDEASRYNGVTAKHAASMLSGTDDFREVASAAQRIADVNRNIVQRYTGVSPIPDIAGPCFAAWWKCWWLLNEWSSRVAAVYEGISEGYQGPMMESVGLVAKELLAEEAAARKNASKEEAKLLRRLRVSIEEARGLVEEGERRAKVGR